MKKYLAIFRIRFINALQYRVAAVAGIVTQFAFGFMFILAFSAFYRNNPAAFPMKFSETVSYIWIQQAFYVLFATWFWENDIAATIMEGSIAYEMVRPLDLYTRWFCQSSANRLARAALRCVFVLTIAFIMPQPYRMTLPPSVLQLASFLLSMILALGVIVAFSMLIYISVFYTLSASGMRFIIAVLADFLAGGTVPLPFFPAPIRAVVELLPFAAMQNMPLRIYSGNISGGDVVKGILLQIFWLVVLILIGKLAMNNALKKVVAQGG